MLWGELRFLWKLYCGFWGVNGAKRDFVLGLLHFGRRHELLGFMENWIVLESCFGLLFILGLFCEFWSVFCSF